MFDRVGKAELTARILVVGDFHIPSRAKNVPDKIKRVMSSLNFDLVLCTGDLVDEWVLRMLNKLGKHVKWVMGNMDYIAGPREVVVDVHGFKIGLVHGDGIFPRGDPAKLYELASRMGVHVLVSGHTHALSITLVKGRLLLNPGSTTGVWGGGPASLKPSLIILEVKPGFLTVKGYELEGKKLNVVTKTYKKVNEKLIEVR